MNLMSKICPLKSKPNPIPTLSVATTGTRLPTVENIYHPRDGKIYTNLSQTQFKHCVEMYQYCKMGLEMSQWFNTYHKHEIKS